MKLFGWGIVLTVVLFVLKLAEVITWSWWLIISPFGLITLWYILWIVGIVSFFSKITK